MPARKDLTKDEILGFQKAALRFIRRSREEILSRWKKSYSMELKSDQSLVTEADIAAEKALRECIRSEFPSHGIIGEEMANTNPDSEFQWGIDPIDGTQNFAHGIPTFGTVLGLHLRGEPVAGVIDHPALDLCYSAAHGCGAFCNGEKLTIKDSPSRSLDPNEVLIISTRGMFKRSGEEKLFDEFMKKHDAMRIYYDVFGHTQAAQGSAGAMIEFNVRIWDLAATQVLVEEAGGKFVQIRKWTPENNKPTFYSAIFGKAAVVDLVSPYFSDISR